MESHHRERGKKERKVVSKPDCVVSVGSVIIESEFITESIYPKGTLFRMVQHPQLHLLPRIFLLIAVFGLLNSIGCAVIPPSQNALSGKRLIVTMIFSGFINPNYSYFFLINNVNDFNATGPVGVFFPPYGNGFATGSGATFGGFTDFIRFDNQQQGSRGYTLNHVVGDLNRSQFVVSGSPLNSVRPDINDPRTGKQLQFEIDLSQLITDAVGRPLPGQQAADMARAIRFLQVNFVAAERVPTDVTSEVNRQTDSLGDTRTQTGRSSFIVLDVSSPRIYQNSEFLAGVAGEPSDTDVFGASSPDPALDLVDWTIEVRQQ